MWLGETHPYRKHLNWAKITLNLSVVFAACALYLIYGPPTTCQSFANVLFAMAANILGLVQRPPVVDPLPASKMFHS